MLRAPLLSLVLSLLLAIALLPATAAGAASRAQASIVGGSEVAEGTWPSVAYVTVDLGGGQAVACTGSVVAAGAILTAAHCVVDQMTGVIAADASVSVVTGRRDLGDERVGAVHAVRRRFTSGHRLAGTLRIVVRGCDSGLVRYVARR